VGVGVSKARFLPLFVILIASTLIIPAYALTWTFPTYPFYASINQHGPMYFDQGFTATNGSWIGGLLCFTDFNYASGGTFANTTGFAASNDTTMTLFEAVPTDHLLLQASSVGALRNVTLWLPGNNVVNVTNVAAWTWDNSTYLLKMTTVLGLSNVYISLVAGGGGPGLIFFIPWWFVNQGGSILSGGVIPHIGTDLMSVMTVFVAWFATSIANIISLLVLIMTGVVGIAWVVVFWFGRIISFFFDPTRGLFIIIGKLFNGTLVPGSMNIWVIFNVSAWIDVIPVFGFMLWFGGLSARRRKTGRSSIEIIIGDLQILMYIVGLVWDWSWLVFNFVWGIASYFLSLLWSKIP
jgi:hypothetical protein